MREIRTSGSMRGGRKRAFAWRACLLLYSALAFRKAFFIVTFSSQVVAAAVLVRQLLGPHLSTWPW